MGWGRRVQEEVRVTLARGWVLPPPPPPMKNQAARPSPPTRRSRAGSEGKKWAGERGEGESVPEVD